MTDRTASISLASVLCVALFAMAFLAAPHSCQGGLTEYFWLGVVVTIALLVIPFVLERKLPILKRTLASLGLVVLGAAVWVSGVFAANISIICRLF
jgi:hypothetical protein